MAVAVCTVPLFVGVVEDDVVDGKVVLTCVLKKEGGTVGSVVDTFDDFFALRTDNEVLDLDGDACRNCDCLDKHLGRICLRSTDTTRYDIERLDSVVGRENDTVDVCILGNDNGNGAVCSDVLTVSGSSSKLGCCICPCGITVNVVEEEYGASSLSDDDVLDDIACGILHIDVALTGLAGRSSGDLDCDFVLLDCLGSLEGDPRYVG